MNSAVDDVFFDAATHQGGAGVRAWVIDRVETVREMIDPYHLAHDVEGLCLAFCNVCGVTYEFKFWHSISEDRLSTSLTDSDLYELRSDWSFRNQRRSAKNTKGR